MSHHFSMDNHHVGCTHEFLNKILIVSYQIVMYTFQVPTKPHVYFNIYGMWITNLEFRLDIMNHDIQGDIWFAKTQGCEIHPCDIWVIKYI